MVSSDGLYTCHLTSNVSRLCSRTNFLSSSVDYEFYLEQCFSELTSVVMEIRVEVVRGSVDN